MSLRGSNNLHIKASTIAELLVVMLMTSILLLAVTDGFTVFGRYLGIISEKVVYNKDVWNGYFRLETLIMSSDSLRVTHSGNVDVYRDDDRMELRVVDSLLLFSKGEIKDTILYSVVGIDVLSYPIGNDSLVVLLSIGGNRTRIAFSPNPKPKITDSELHKLEDDYKYE